MTLRQHAISGIRWTTLSALGRAALQFVQIAILARLLSPADFGLMALVVAILAFLQIFADAGVSNAIIHHQDINQNQLSSLYWLNIIVSAALALMLVGASGWAAAWYQQPKLQYLLWLAGLVIVAGAVAQQLRIVAQKNLRFSVLAKIELMSALVGFSVAVSSACAGMGGYSLILGALANALTSSGMAWGLLADGWQPSWYLRFSEIRHFLKFGAYMVGNNLINTFNSQVDVLLGGKLHGAQAIGLYSVPKELNLRIAGIINPIVTQVGMPVMAKVQEDDVLLRRIYLQTMRMTASVNFPIYILLYIFAPEVVHMLLGASWAASISLLQIFSIWALLRSTGNPVGALLMAKGRADLSFKWNAVWLLITPLTIWVGSQYGVAGMATSMTVLGIVGYWPNWYFLVKPLCGACLKEYTTQLAIPLVLSVIAGGVGWLSAFMFAGDLFRLIFGVFAGALVYAVSSYRFNRVWVDAIMALVWRGGR